jgi:uncharacterized membrane protein
LIPQTRQTPTQNLITIVCAMILIGTEVFGVAFAAGWAIAGLFELGETVSYVLMGAFSLLGAWAMLAIWRRATQVEPIRA